MRGNELLDKMELVDPAYVEAADAVRKGRNLRRIRWVVIAACLCLLIGTTTVLAATGLGTKVLRIFKSHEESGYELSAEIVKFPVEELKGDIREVSELIKQQYASYQPTMSSFPGSLERAFKTRDEACNYIGFDRIKRLQLNAEEGQTILRVDGTANGDFNSVSVETGYTAGDIRMQFFTNIYTENAEGEITIGAFTTEKVDFTETFYTTKNGKTLHIIEESALNSGYLSKDGYLVEDGVLYLLHISYQKKDADQADALLKQWADLF